MNICVPLQGQVGHSRGDSERRGGRRRGKSRCGEWAARFSTICQRGDVELVQTNMLMLKCWCTTTSLRWWRTCGVRSSCRWSTRGASRAPADLPFDRWPSDHHVRLRASFSVSDFQQLQSRISSVVSAYLCLLTVLTVTLESQLVAWADIWRLPTVIYPFLYG